MLSPKLLTIRTLEILAFAGLAYGFALVAKAVGGPHQPHPTVEMTGVEAKLVHETLGTAQGKTVLVEFMDFQCPSCRAAYTVISRILSRHPGVAYQPVSYPLNIHQYAQGAAIAYEAAKSKGQGERAFRDLLSGATDLDNKSLNAYLLRNGLPDQLSGPSAREFEASVGKQHQLGLRLRIAGTPTFFVMKADGSLEEVVNPGALDSLLG